MQANKTLLKEAVEETGKKDFDIQYEYVPSEQSEIRLQSVFEMIFEKIIKAEEYNQSQQYLNAANKL